MFIIIFMFDHIHCCTRSDFLFHVAVVVVVVVVVVALLLSSVQGICRFFIFFLLMPACIQCLRRTGVFSGDFALRVKHKSSCVISVSLCKLCYNRFCFLFFCVVVFLL